MSAQNDAANFLSNFLLGGGQMPAPSGHTTKTINGKSQTVSASEAWVHPSTNQTDVPTIKVFLNAVAEDLHKRGDRDRANAVLIRTTQF